MNQKLSLSPPQIAQLQQRLEESSNRAEQLETLLRDAETRADKERKERDKERKERDKERKERDKLESNLAELQMAMTNHVEELVKNHEALMTVKDEEVRRLQEAMAQLKEELEMAVKSKETVASQPEKRDHSSAMLTPKGPAAKRQSSGAYALLVSALYVASGFELVRIHVLQCAIHVSVPLLPISLSLRFRSRRHSHAFADNQLQDGSSASLGSFQSDDEVLRLGAFYEQHRTFPPRPSSSSCHQSPRSGFPNLPRRR